MPARIHDSSCEIRLPDRGKRADRNRIAAFQKGFRWKGASREKYKSPGSDWSDIAKQVLVGAHGESAGFHLRYFEIKPGGFSSFETHRHEHVVIGIRGRGKARLNRRNVNINCLDVLYVKSGTPHRFYNPYNRPFGFFCIVKAKRDKPVSLKK